jgi:uncharacterized protein with von Willebrand factor type A (vWA) domain
MQIAKTIKSIDKTFRGMPLTQKAEVFIMTDTSDNYFIKLPGRLIRVSREDAQEYFQNNFNDFWKYLEINQLHEQFPDLYTKKEALEVQRLYANTPKKKINDADKVYNYYENFISYSM